MDPRHKIFKLAESKASDTGAFTALAAVFGNVDSVGDRMMKGAFAKTLERWRALGDPIPVFLSHQWDDPMALIGRADPGDVVETDAGLLVKGRLDLEHNAVAQQVHRLMRDRLLKGWSFGYTVPPGGEKRAADGANEVFEVDLIEFGPTLKGANPAAELQSVKSALTEASAEEGTPPPTDEVEGARDKAKASPEASDPIGDEMQIALIRALATE